MNTTELLTEIFADPANPRRRPMPNHNPLTCPDEDCHRRVCRQNRQDNAEKPELEQAKYNRADRRRLGMFARPPRARRLPPHPLAAWTVTFGNRRGA